ncbi:MAG: DEAD/DEAH box helicase [Dehalococcoidia bacterium]
MTVQTAIERLQHGGPLASSFVEWREIPAEAARFDAWRGVDERIVEALARRGVGAPYVHQAAAIEGALAGEDVVVVTPPASGKTLCYTVPVLQAILDEPRSRALYLFPTKALAQDQLHELHGLVTEAGVDVKTFTYDGDTNPTARRQVRTAGHVVITNPDMLHTGILPHHTKWTRLFEHLRYVVVDELHTYRGVFGSNVANVIRRLRRICAFYGSNPTFICCSATIANPGELAEALLGRAVRAIDDSGAPRGRRVVGLFNPPVVNRELGIRQGVINAATNIASELQDAGVQTLVFAGSRTRVELLTQYLREAPGGLGRPGEPERVRGYRSGYLPKERREIEAAMREGRVRSVVATNALELGIDVGGLDAVVVAGYPGTVASLRQQMGRAGRRQAESLAVLVASSSPLDQYVVAHPEYLFGGAVEAGRIDADNPMIAAEHLKCAVFELPVEATEYGLLGRRSEELAHALVETGMVHRSAEGRLYWSDEAFPAHEVSLRTGADANVVIIEQGVTPRVIGEVDRPSAMTLVHDEAIYVHDGRQYHVDLLDWEELKAYVRPVDVDYYTDAHLAVDLKVIEEWEAENAGPATAWGEVSITYLATLFKKIRLHTHENIGWGRIKLPQDDMHTASFWLTLEPSVTRGVRDIEGALLGLGQLLAQVAPLLLMCDAHDLQLATQVKSPHTGLPTVFLWETVPGGIGFSEHLFREAERLVAFAREVVEECGCYEGCPGCVGPPGAPGLGVRADVLALVRALSAVEAVA